MRDSASRWSFMPSGAISRTSAMILGLGSASLVTGRSAPPTSSETACPLASLRLVALCWNMVWMNLSRTAIRSACMM
ncbi:MAG: hypothetical protein A2085_06015 [Gemmatimonadetes bacterium GWC2_71_10]|nr:MAG: hypothetical protein A2085_06015 [Gemmatimonadetes bacterium GWC2_71_10]